jgi:hypothetical protein
MKNLFFSVIAAGVLACTSQPSQNENLMKQIQTNEYFDFVKEKALEVVKSGFNAGDGYGEVWIRDYNNVSST